MNSRSTLILVLVALVVAGLVALDFHKGTSTDEANEKRRKIIDLDETTVRSVELTRTNETIVLEKQGDHWEIREPLKTRADFSAVRSILDELEFAQRERTLTEKELAGVDLADFGLKPPRLRLTLTGEDGPVTILLGAATPTKESVYIQVAGKPSVFVVSKSIEGRLDKRLSELRDRTVLDFTATEATRLELKSADRAIEFAEIDGRWRMLQPFNARANQTKLNELLNDLSLLRIQDFVSDDPKDVVTYRLNEPVREVSVWKDQSSESLTLLLGHPVSNDVAKVYAKRKGADAIFTINDAKLAQLDVQPNDLRDPNVFTLSAPDVQGVVLQRGAHQIALVRTNDAWQLTAPFTGPAADDKVETLVRLLTGVAITQYTADVASDLEKYGLAVPNLIVMLTGATTNTMTHLLVGAVDSSNGVQYVKRADEAFVYGVATNLTEWIPTDPWSLRGPRVVAMSPDQVTRLTIATGGKQTALERGDDKKWKLVEPVTGVLDESALTDWLNVFAELRAEKFYDPAAHPTVTGELTVTAVVADKTRVLTVAAPEKDGNSLASWDDPRLVFELSAPTVQTLKKQLVKPQ